VKSIEMRSNDQHLSHTNTHTTHNLKDNLYKFKGHSNRNCSDSRRQGMLLQEWSLKQSYFLYSMRNREHKAFKVLFICKVVNVPLGMATNDSSHHTRSTLEVLQWAVSRTCHCNIYINYYRPFYLEDISCLTFIIRNNITLLITQKIVHSDIYY
jgi:hypothetical protein